MYHTTLSLGQDKRDREMVFHQVGCFHNFGEINDVSSVGWLHNIGEINDASWVWWFHNFGESK
jgi:hypothetical protein